MKHTARGASGGKGTYDLKVSDVVLTFKPKWFDSIPWEKSAQRKLSDDDLFTLGFMDMIEGHVCAAYVHVALSSIAIRSRTQRTDFIVGWGAQQNWHGISLHRFIDQYHGRTVSTRDETQDTRRSKMSFASKHSALLAGLAASTIPNATAAVYACMGYRNEVMTMHGYGSLLSKVNEKGIHPVLDPLLKNIMKEEAAHARYYKEFAVDILQTNPRLQKIARKAMDYWWGIVGENYAGRTNADRLIRYLFRDARGTELAVYIDKIVSSLPGLTGITPMKNRVALAFAR